MNYELADCYANVVSARAISAGLPSWRFSVIVSIGLALERVYCGTAGNNIGMKRLAIQMGMVEEGRCRKHLFLNGKWEDVIEYGVLRDELKDEVSRAR